MGIEALIAASLATVFSASAAASIAAGIVAIGSSLISTGVSLVGRALFGADRRAAAPLVDEGVRQTVRQATPRQRIVYGTRLVGGAISYIDKNPPYLVVQYLVAAHRSELVGVQINGRVVALNANGDAVDVNFNRDGVSLLSVSAREGDLDQALDPILAEEFPDLPASFRQRGQTVVTVRADYGADRDQHEEVWGQSGAFEPVFVIRGKPIYDPRDPSQVIDDETTWRWSDNWALVLADWMRAPYGGRKRAVHIDWQRVAREADLCDQPVGQAKGGVQRRYTCDATFLTSDDPYTVLNDMLVCAGQGRAIWSRGKFFPLADVPREPVATITQAHLADAFTFQAEAPRRDAPNVVRADFIYRDRDWQAATTPALVREDLIALDGERLEAALRLPYVTDEERAQRLAKIALERGRLGRRLAVTLWREMLALEVGDEVTVELADFGFANGAYTVDRISRIDRLDRMLVSLVEAATEAVHAWDPAVDTQDTDLITFPEAA